MAYIGQSPTIGEFKKLDDISSQFNDSTDTFALQVAGSSVFPGTAQALLISLNGVIQEPGIAFSISDSDIVFTTPPNTGSTFFGVLLGSVGQVIIPADGSVTTNKLAPNLQSSGVTAASYGNSTLIPRFTVGVDGRITDASNVSIVAGATITDDTSTNLDAFYPVMANSQTSGNFTDATVSSTKLYFNPNTGIFNATDFNSLSDATLKTNLHPIENATSLLDNLTGFEFNWKDNNRKSAGVIAQDVETILPHLVSLNANGTKSVNYGSLTAYLIQCVKELTNRIKELEKKNGS